MPAGRPAACLPRRENVVSVKIRVRGRAGVVTAVGAQGDEAAAPGGAERTGAGAAPSGRWRCRVTGARRDRDAHARGRRRAVAFSRPWGPGAPTRFPGRDPPPTLCHLLRPNQVAALDSGRHLSLARPVPDGVTACSLPPAPCWPEMPPPQFPSPGERLPTEKTLRSDAAPTGQSRTLC